jgi:pyruvate dehydrogenase E2 component (dihydrolipoamide acetyltransferase)
MAEIVRMPKMSDTMTEGVVSKWHKKVGDNIKSGELVAEIETDKATMEFESYHDGILLFRGVEEGQAVLVDGVLAIVGEKGEDYKALLEAELKKSSQASAAEKSEPVKAEIPKEIEHIAEAKPTVEPATIANQQKIETYTFTDADRQKASPLAKKLAHEKGIDLRFVKGTGENGRIVKRDIDWYKSLPSGTGTALPISGKESYEEVPVSQMRKTIAKRLSESKFTAPHFYLTMEIDMSNIIEAREGINEFAKAKISYNDLVIKACASSLRKHPKVNSAWLGDKTRINHHVHIGVAVAVDEGLLVPVVRFADQKTLTQIGSEVKEFASKAREKKLQPSDWEGNTFTISNLGMFGIDEFTAIINPPDACILAVGGIREVPVVKNGVIVPGNRMKVTLSCDHRIVDGVAGSAFLQTLKFLIENPAVLLGEQSI